MNFWKSSKRPLTIPPPHFRKVILRVSRQNCDKSAYVHMEELLCILWSYFPWDACSTNVQHGNRVKTYPKKTFLYHFHGQKPCLKVQILQYKFLYWEWPPSPLRNFSIQAYRHTGIQECTAMKEVQTMNITNNIVTSVSFKERNHSLPLTCIAMNMGDDNFLTFYMQGPSLKTW